MVFPKVSIIVPTWNRKKDCLECLASVKKLVYPKKKFEVVLVDNGSIDGTVEAVKKRFPEATILALKKNYGFPGALNRGIKKTKGDYVLILQSDTVVEKNFLKNLIKVAEKSKLEIGAFGPKVYYYHQKNVINKAYGKINRKTLHLTNVGKGEKDRGQYDKIREVETTAFTGILIKREVFDKIGLLDERLFLYFEDVDFFLRAERAGYKFLFVPQARIWDKEKATFGKETPQTIYYLIRNKLIVENKLRPFSHFEHIRNIRFMLSSSALMAIDKAKRNHLRAVVLGIFDFYRKRFGQKEIKR